MIFASFDYGFNWEVTDATGTVVESFSSGTATYQSREISGTPPFRVWVGFPDTRGTWIEGGFTNDTLIGVMGEDSSPVISAADPGS